jgi:hypothetical protein
VTTRATISHAGEGASARVTSGGTRLRRSLFAFNTLSPSRELDAQAVSRATKDYLARLDDAAFGAALIVAMFIKDDIPDKTDIERSPARALLALIAARISTQRWLVQ